MNAESQTRTALRTKLAGVRRKLLLCTAGTGVALVLASTVALVSLGMVVDWLGELPWLGRALVLLVNLGLIGWIARRQIVIPLQTAPDEEGCALLVEHAIPEFRTRLIASLQLTRPGRLPDGHSEALVRALVQETEILAAPMHFKSVVSARQFYNCGLLAVVILVTAAVALQRGAPASEVLLRRAFLANVPVPHQTRTEVLTGNRKIGQGESVVITAQATGRVPARGRLLIRSATGSAQEFPMPTAPDASTRFVQSIENVQESFTYQVRLNDDTSPPFTVQVLERPVVTRIECQQVYPAYTQLAARQCAPTDLKLLAGSRLQLTIRANKNIAAATVRLTGLNTEAPAQVSPLDRQRVRSEIQIPATGLTGFTVQLRDEDGLSSPAMAVYRIAVTPDQPPTVALNGPDRPEELVTSRATVLLDCEARDDFGIAQLALHYRSPALHQNAEQIVDFDLASPTPRALRRRHEWHLAALADTLPPETRIEYWLTARDANDVTGPGCAATGHSWLKVVSADDKRADLMNRLDDYLNTLSRVADEEERLQQNLGTLIFGKITGP